MRRNSPLFLLFMSFISFTISAQENMGDTNIFLRIYNPKGIKFSKGKLVSIQDNAILLRRHKKNISIKVSEIGRIKTKRALGHNIGIGALAGTSAGIIYGFAQGADGGAFGTNSGGDNALVFGTLGLLAGSFAGGISGIGKKSRSFEINKDPEQLRKFREIVHE